MIEEALLQEPNLWTPGKKPIGKVVVDKTNPISQKVIGMWLMDNTTVINNLVNGKLTYATGSNIEFSTDANGRSTYTQKRDTPSYFDTGIYNSDTQDRTVQVIWTPYSNPVTPVVAPWAFHIAGNSDRLHFAWDHSNGTTYYRTVQGYFSTSGWQKIQWGPQAIGQRSVLAYTFTSGEYHVYQDGAHVSSITGLDTLGGADGAFFIHTGQASSGNANGTIESVIVWDRKLEAGEVASIALDPYQFLIPA